MKLDRVKNSSTGYFRTGFDKYSDNYLLETNDTFGNKRYFIITEEQYHWFDNEPTKFEELVKKCVEENSSCNLFFFSTWEKENSNEQNRLMWKYTYIDMLLGKKRDEIHKRLGEPDETLEDNKIEVFNMSSKLEIQAVFDTKKCVDVRVTWKECIT